MNSRIIALGLVLTVLYFVATAIRRVREARAAQIEYDRRRAEAVLRALEASRGR